MFSEYPRVRFVVPPRDDVPQWLFPVGDVAFEGWSRYEVLPPKQFAVMTCQVSTVVARRARVKTVCTSDSRRSNLVEEGNHAKKVFRNARNFLRRIVPAGRVCFVVPPRNTVPTMVCFS